MQNRTDPLTSSLVVKHKPAAKDGMFIKLLKHGDLVGGHAKGLEDIKKEMATSLRANQGWSPKISLEM